jgi:hypothetical protein
LQRKHTGNLLFSKVQYYRLKGSCPMSGIPTAVLHFSAITQDQYDQAKASLSPQLYALKGTTVLTLNNQNAHWGDDSITFDGGGAGVTTDNFWLE